MRCYYANFNIINRNAILNIVVKYMAESIFSNKNFYIFAAKFLIDPKMVKIKTSIIHGDFYA